MASALASSSSPKKHSEHSLFSVDSPQRNPGVKKIPSRPAPPPPRSLEKQRSSDGDQSSNLIAIASSYRKSQSISPTEISLLSSLSDTKQSNTEIILNEGPSATNKKLNKSSDDILSIKNSNRTKSSRILFNIGAKLTRRPPHILRMDSLGIKISRTSQNSSSQSAPSTPIVKWDERKSPPPPANYSVRSHNKIKQTLQHDTKPKAPPVKFDKTSNTYKSGPRKPPPPRRPPPSSTRPPRGKQPSKETIYTSIDLFSNQRLQAPIAHYASCTRDDLDITPYAVFTGLPIDGSDEEDYVLMRVDEPLDRSGQLYTPLKPPVTNDNQLSNSSYTRVLRKSNSCDGIYSTIPGIDGVLSQHTAAVITLKDNQDDAYTSLSKKETKDDKESSDETEHKYANLLVSSSMVELRSNHDYMEIDRLTLDRPTVASDYQQPIALRRLPGPPTAVKERQQRRDETRILRGTIVVLDENKTLEV